MEKYLIVTEQNSLRKDYIDYLQNERDINVIAKKFMEDNKFETHEYSCSNDVFYIVPTDKDFATHLGVLSNNVGHGLRKFKGNSKVGKAWTKAVKESGLKVIYKPYIPLYFKNADGNMWTNIFKIGNNVYCYLKCEHDFETPDGMIEIKASEYYKIIEDYNEGL